MGYSSQYVLPLVVSCQSFTGTNAIYYFGSMPKPAATQADKKRVYCPVSGIINYISLTFDNATPGTNENVTIWIYKNNSTPYTVTATADFSQSPLIITSNTAGCPVNKGDYIEIRISFPGMATFPITGCGGIVLINYG